MTAANVLAIHALDELKAGLARFGGEAHDALSAAEQKIQRTLDWLQERANHWRNEVRRREEMVRQAEAALARCMASGYYDRDGHYHAPDCSAYENALLQARVRLREAEAELRNVQQWTQHVQQAVAEYQREAQRLAAMLGSDLAKASALLSNSADILRSYVAMSAPALGASSTPESRATPSSSGPTITWSEQRAILQRLDAGHPITIDELRKLQQIPSDLRTETRAEDESWIQQILESERYREAMRASQEVDLDLQYPSKALRDALLATLKAIQYWRSKP
jgi:hypothetical protein